MSEIRLAEVRSMDDAAPILTDIDWGFSSPFSIGRSGKRHLFDCRRHHWYPATFIPEIPFALIQSLAKPGAVILDPFNGIGTTVIQALLLGHQVMGSDVCRISLAFTENLLKLFRSDVDFEEVRLELNDSLRLYDANIDYSTRIEKSHVNASLLRPWYEPGTYNQLMFLAELLARTDSAELSAAGSIAFSSTLKSACAQDRGWGCIADNMLPSPAQRAKPRDALRKYSQAFSILLRDMTDARARLPSISKEFLKSTPLSNIVMRRDARQVGEHLRSEIDLVVTSPPYPSMTDYAMSQRLSYYWHGAEPSVDLADELGARRHRFRSHAVRDYGKALSACLTSIGSALRIGGYACFVMPEFDVSGNTANPLRRQVVQESLSRLISDGFVLEREIARILPSRRRHHNQSWTSLDREHIYIYRKVQ